MRLGRPQRASLERDTRSRGQPGEVLKGTHHRDSGGGGVGGGEGGSCWGTPAELGREEITQTPHPPPRTSRATPGLETTG